MRLLLMPTIFLRATTDIEEQKNLDIPVTWSGTVLDPIELIETSILQK